MEKGQERPWPLRQPSTRVLLHKPCSNAASTEQQFFHPTLGGQGAGTAGPRRLPWLWLKGPELIHCKPLLCHRSPLLLLGAQTPLHCVTETGLPEPWGRDHPIWKPCQTPSTTISPHPRPHSPMHTPMHPRPRPHLHLHPHQCPPTKMGMH